MQGKDVLTSFRSKCFTLYDHHKYGVSFSFIFPYQPIILMDQLHLIFDQLSSSSTRALVKLKVAILCSSLRCAVISANFLLLSFFISLNNYEYLIFDLASLCFYFNSKNFLLFPFIRYFVIKFLVSFICHSQFQLPPSVFSPSLDVSRSLLSIIHNAQYLSWEKFQDVTTKVLKITSGGYKWKGSKAQGNLMVE